MRDGGESKVSFGKGGCKSSQSPRLQDGRYFFVFVMYHGINCCSDATYWTKHVIDDNAIDDCKKNASPTSYILGKGVW